MTLASQTAATETEEITDVPGYCRQLAAQAQTAAQGLTQATGEQRRTALLHMARALRDQAETIQRANAQDLEAGRSNGLSEALLDRLTLDAGRIEKMAGSIEQIADQPDPVGRVMDGRVLGNGIRLQKVRVPIGVVLIIYESRPNVTCDAAALCLKSGNSVILRGGKEAGHSNRAIAHCVRQGLEAAGLDPNLTQMVQTPDRQAVTELLHREGEIDLCIPRGGESLIKAVVEQARIPVIKHYTGNCHTYVDSPVASSMAMDICINAKTQRYGVCNATETFLVHRDHVASGWLAQLCEKLQAAGVAIRGDATVQQACPQASAASDSDWDEEFLDAIVAMRVVDSLDQAIGHINAHGSKHTDAILTDRLDAAEAFVNQVDSANVLVNASTRFSDGNQYGLGAEIGISTDKLHARGPMGADDLTTYKWVAYGNGQVRE
jgi:glutamate-5-semialdehyde dehydrogenase